MVEILRVGKPTVEGKISRDVVCHHHVDELSEQDIVITEDQVAFFTPLALYEAAKLKGVVLAASAYVIRDQIVVSNLVPFLGVIPAISYLVDSLPIMIDQHIVQGDDTLCTITGRRIFLEPIQPPSVQLRDIPWHFLEPSIQT